MELSKVLQGVKILDTILNLPIGSWMDNVKIEKTYGLIHKSTAVVIHGTKGFLIWDYIAFNEITFKDVDENIVSLYRGFSDQDTERMWHELVEKYGV